MSHKGFADFLHDSGFHQARVKGVAEIVEAEWSNSGAPEGRLPRGLDPMERPVMEGEDYSLGLLYWLQAGRSREP